jgi:molybdopterin molybdotransferase
MTTAAQRGQAALEPVDSYLVAVLSAIRPLAVRDLSLAAAEADGAVLAADVTAAGPLPPFDNSAMDGYAIRAADVASASEDAPVTPGRSSLRRAPACGS